jgi:hypothetical protein
MSEIGRLERDPLRRCERRSPAAAPVSFVHCPGAGGVEYLQKDPWFGSRSNSGMH